MCGFAQANCAYEKQRVIIIDGLDECRQPNTPLQYLAEIHSHCKTLKLFILSRSGTVKINNFDEAVIISNLDTGSDMANYIETEIRKRRKGSAITSIQATELESILKHKAQGM